MRAPAERRLLDRLAWREPPDGWAGMLPAFPPDATGTARGGYVLAETDGGTPEVILIATGREVQIALAAQALLRGSGVAATVVSMPCLKWFAEQDDDYREHVLPASLRARVSITQPRAGDHDRIDSGKNRARGQERLT